MRKEEVTMAYDPVCKMEVNERDTQYTSEYEGRLYYFCSPGCKTEFDATPHKFAVSESTTGYGAGMQEKAGQTYRKFKESQAYQKAVTRGEEYKSKAREQARSAIDKQRGRTSDTLGTVANALRQTAQQLQSQQQESMARYADGAANRVERLSGYLRDKDADQLINEAERMVRRQPALFLGGAFALGFVLSRFLKSSGGRTGRYGGARGYSTPMNV
jgi:YHS domain-containing protein